MVNFDQAVAVVGVGCRLPGGIDHLDGLWTALHEGRDLVTRMPADRFPEDVLVDPGAVRPCRSYTAAGGFLEDVSAFDPAYFGISPREARFLDPQQRLLLEVAAEAVDDAGIPAESLAGSDTCVYVGVSELGYGTFVATMADHTSPHTMPGTCLSIVANRLSYAFDLRGPSLAVDTACSSSLVAVDHACRALRAGSSRVALAGGVNVLTSPYSFAGFSYAGMLSRRGRCAAFSADADGFVRAEGGAVLVLKRLADAVADGDRVHAVIAGTGSNSDGRTQGMTLPSAESQAALLHAVYEETGTGPDELVYFEAHGTGTPVGDPAEATAVGRVLGRRRTGGPLPIGSVKSNLGHLEPASGIVGLLKAVLVLRHRLAPASLHALPLNPAIDFGDLGLAPTVAPVELPRTEQAAVGVNSFGFGGANAHAVVTAAPAPPAVAPQPAARRVPLVISARSGAALRQMASRMAARLRAADPHEFPDLAYTATLRRSAHPYRAAVLATGPEQAAEQMDRLFAGEPADGADVRRAERGTVAFVYSGNASQWPGMAADLLEAEPDFRAAVDEADAALAPRLGWSVAKELAHPDPARWQRTEIAQPVLFAVQVGLTALLAANGVRPAAVMGHSVGEVAAAHAAGALTLEQAAAVIAERGRAQGATAGRGRMAAVGLPEREAAAELHRYGGALEIAGVNSDRDVTVAGDPDALAGLGAELGARDVFFRDLGLDYAFHSRAMDPVEDPLRSALADLAPGAARVPFVSTVTGAPLPGPELDGRYWWRNVREPVRFAEAARHVVAEHAGILVEIGPHPVLRPYLRSMDAVCLPTLHRDGDGPREAAAAVAALLAAGAHADWEAHFPRRGRVVDLPAYPWQHERYWHGAPQNLVLRTSGTGLREHPLLGERLPAPHPLWHGSVEPQLVPWLGDHQVAGSVLMPAAAYVEMALTAGREVLKHSAEVRHLEISRPLVVPWPDPGPLAVQTAVTPADGTLTLSAREEYQGECRPVVRAQVRTLVGRAPGPLDVPAVTGRCPRTIEGPDYYRFCHTAGLGCGPALQVLRTLHVGQDELLASYHLPHPAGAYTVHPALLDASLQATLALTDRADPGAAAYLPSAFGAVRSWRTPAEHGVVHLRRRGRGANEMRWDITYADPDGTVTLEIDDCRTRQAHLDDPTPLTVQRTVLRAAPTAADAAPPPPLPDPVGMAAAAAERITAARAALEESGHQRFVTAAERAGAHCWAAALAGLLHRRPAEPFEISHLVSAGLDPRHRRLVRLMLPLLVRYGFVQGAGPAWRLTGAPAQPGAMLRQLVEDHPASGAEALLLNRHLRGLPGMLRGTTAPGDLLPAADPTYPQLRETGPAHRCAHRVVQALLGVIVDRWPADQPLRVLEVGAATGALTAAALPVLPPERTRYVCTAATAAGFARARRRFAGFDFATYRTLDLDDDPAGQGLRPGSFDLVLAGDALHAVKDVTAALRRLRALLTPGGRLLAVEPHQAPVHALLRGGLEEFWVRRDRDLRPTSRLLAAERWEPLLRQCGFPETTRTGLTDRSVILAAAGRDEAPGASVPRTGGPWVIAVEDGTETPTARALAALLGGADVITADTGTAAWARALAAHARPRVVLLLAEPQPGEPAVDRTVRRAAVLRALATACAEPGEAARAPRVWLVTRPTGLFPAPERPAHPADAAIWGACRTLANERPDLALRRVSFDRAGDPAADARRLAAELLAAGPQDEDTGDTAETGNTQDAGDAEDEVVLTRRGRFVPRRVAHAADAPPAGPSSAPFALDVRDPGRSRRLVWRCTDLPEPGPGEVVIEMRAVSLNYRDPLRANGLLPAEAAGNGPVRFGLGSDGAGVVSAVGPGVDGWRIGDRVCGAVPDALASHVVARATALSRIPDGWSFAEASTLPIAFLTVHHCLVDLARLAPGERVLVHGGAGAVGLAVLQCARAQGARVIATAGTETKRDLLRTLGAEHVLDSRSLDFAAQVRELTGGLGVDVVVNSLSGEAIARSLDLLRPNGRFIELGKRDILLNSPLLLRPFQRSLSFFGFNLDSVSADPVREARLAADFRDRVADGTYRPLPHVVFPAARIEEAFHLLQHSRHTGKVVVSFDALDEPVPVEPGPRPWVPDGEGTYLVTGGLGGFGAATARWLAERGVRHLALVSRRGADAPDAPEVLAQLRRHGARVTAHAADVTDPDALRRVLASVDATGHPLRGVVHAAMHMDDALLAEITDDRFAAVLAPKAAGAALLQQLTGEHDLELFLTWSSVAADIGNHGQSAYAAANAYLEALTRARRAAGRPGTSLAWGPIGQTGYIARRDMEGAMAERGFEPLTPAEALAVAGRLLAEAADVAGAGRYRWSRAARLLPALSAPRFGPLVPAETAGPRADARADLRQTLAALSADEALAAVTRTLTELLAAVLQTDPAELDPRRPVTDFGLDSLLSTQFLLQAREHFDVRLAPGDLMGAGRTLGHYAGIVHRRLALVPDADT
ncbi:SDR family NAD(P)-dependent oxidoreductase [Streptomyces fumanus]|uniref:SDR family NAD(P)-dependent oxidoreductase n=1 Tax=Streptomyces fumanus TaxID=67302 RepID=UPI0033E68FE9